MSILIKGMEMPDNCNSCSFSVNGFCVVSPKRANGEAMSKRTTTNWCPLIKIPTPHGDLIDRYVLLKSMEMIGNPQTVSEHINNIVRFLDALMDAPAVILAEPPKEEPT